jgi:Ca-activated chloride channel family protein
MLADIAAASGGAYVRSGAGEFGLEYLYEHEISRMEKREIESRIERSYYDRYQWPLGIALLLLLIETLLSTRRLLRDKV